MAFYFFMNQKHARLYRNTLVIRLMAQVWCLCSYPIYSVSVLFPWDLYTTAVPHRWKIRSYCPQKWHRSAAENRIFAIRHLKSFNLNTGSPYCVVCDQFHFNKILGLMKSYDKKSDMTTWHGMLVFKIKSSSRYVRMSGRLFIIRTATRFKILLFTFITIASEKVSLL